MRSPFLALIALVAALGCGARTNLPCPAPADKADEKGFCDTEDLEPDPEPDPNRCETSVPDAPSCVGTGLIWKAPDECVDDSGDSAVGDQLEVYCVDGSARFCLSLEACPWRDGMSMGESGSCSPSGLGGEHMATMINDCVGWEGHAVYCCSPDGRIGFPATDS